MSLTLRAPCWAHVAGRVIRRRLTQASRTEGSRCGSLTWQARALSARPGPLLDSAPRPSQAKKENEPDDDDDDDDNAEAGPTSGLAMKAGASVATIMVAAMAREMPWVRLNASCVVNPLLSHNAHPPNARRSASSRHHLTAAMQTPAAPAAAAAAAARPPHRGNVACLSAALAVLLSRAAGAELSEDELLDGLRDAKLITYPSPLLGRLLGILPGRLFELLVLLPWWMLVRMQGPSSPRRLRTRLSGALAEELAGP